MKFRVLEDATLIGSYSHVSEEFRAGLQKEFDLLLPLGRLEYGWLYFVQWLCNRPYFEVFHGIPTSLTQQIEANLLEDLNDPDPDPNIRLEIRMFSWIERRKIFCVYAAFRSDDSSSAGSALFGEQLVVRKSLNKYVLFRQNYPDD